MNVRPTRRRDHRKSAEDGLWFKDAIIYQLHVRRFRTATATALAISRAHERLDYLRDLGVTTLWLLPFYPSPGRDDGYESPTTATSIPRSAPWGISAVSCTRRSAATCGSSPNWSSITPPISTTGSSAPSAAPGLERAQLVRLEHTDQKYQGTRIIFTDTEKSNWAWDHEAGAYYWHRFFSHQPDLNFDNPRVVRAVLQVMKRWLDVGVDGFRLDAVPYLCEREGTNNENLLETHAVLKRCAPHSTTMRPARCCWPKPTSGRRTCRLISATATNATWLTTSR